MDKGAYQHGVILPDLDQYSIRILNDTTGRALHVRADDPEAGIVVCDMTEDGTGDNFVTFYIDDIVSAWDHLTTFAEGKL